MAAAQNKPIAPSVLCHAFNKAGDMIALSPNSNQVFIYDTHGSEEVDKWNEKYVLSEHGGLIAGIDWDHNTNSIVTCGHDRNAYVWVFDAAKNEWKPTLVILRINRAATAVKWSPLGNKFAVTSGAKTVPICHYEKANDWWVCKMLKKHKSTVLSVSWSPNNKFVITGSSDNRARIFSTYIKKLDQSADESQYAELFPQQNTFGELLAEFDIGKSWIHSVSWAPSPYRVAFTGHNSTTTFVDLAAGGHQVQVIPNPDLPFLTISFLSNDALIGAGFSCNPVLFTNTGGKWAVKQELDSKDKAAVAGPAKSAFADARKLFSDSASKGISVQSGGKASEETTLSTRHQNTITCLWGNKPGLVTTSGVDGRILFWELSKYGVDVSGLHIT